MSFAGIRSEVNRAVVMTEARELELQQAKQDHAGLKGDVIKLESRFEQHVKETVVLSRTEVEEMISTVTSVEREMREEQMTEMDCRLSPSLANVVKMAGDIKPLVDSTEHF